MAHSVSDILASMEQRLLLEQSGGFRDRATAGGSLAPYAAYWCRIGAEASGEADVKRAFEQLAETLNGYSELEPELRKARVEAALALLAGLRRSLLQELDLPYEEKGPKGGKKRWPARLEQMGISTRRDLLYHFPRDYAPLRTIDQLRDGERACTLARAVRRHVRPLRPAGRMVRTRYSLEIEDGTGQAVLTSFALRPKHSAASDKFSPIALPYEPGTTLLIDGNVKRTGPYVEMIYVDAQPADGLDFLKPGQLVPVYPLTEGVYQNQLRRAIRALVERYASAIPDPIPREMRRRHGLVSLDTALPQIHWPESTERRDAARRRIVFEEFLLLQLALAARREEVKRQGGVPMSGMDQVLEQLRPLLPYELTAAQVRTIREIGADMASGRVMSRLLQGDVGSGKTLVALAAMLLAVRNGCQAAIMAPTEILAEQHFLVFSHLLEPLGVNIELLIGSITGSRKRQIQERVAAGQAQVVVGTHALIEEAVAFRALGLAVIDEQHRFGVLQRARLQQKALRPRPHVLVMTATPIPRTLAMTVFGDLDVSVIDEMPPGRKPPRTFHRTHDRLPAILEFIRRQLAEGRQAYFVYPAIEESEKAAQLRAATTMYERLREELRDFRVALLHGRLKSEEKEQILKGFASGEIQALVSTVVIEVGIDVPNATIMVIDNAERFGLSQLHQLRGRIGRGPFDSYCILLADPKTEEARRRIAALLSTTDGFKIAERDLEIRGPGEFLGTRQSGALSDLRVANLVTDVKLLGEARADAFEMVRRGLAQGLLEAVRARHPDRLLYVQAR